MPRARRGRGEGSVYQRKSNGFWCGSYSVRDEYGRLHRKTIERKTKTLVLEALAKARTSGAIVTPTRGSVGEWLERWLADVARPRVDSGTYPQYTNIVRRHIVPAIGEIELARLDPARVRAFYGDLARRAVGSATQRQIHALLRSALKTAVEWDLIPSNPCDRVERPKIVRGKRPTLPVELIGRFWGLACADRRYGVYVIAVMVGIRQGEIFGMQWGDLDLERGTLWLQHNLQ